MKIFSFTDRGLVRQSNEDALWMNGELGLFLVADGIGTGGTGAKAAQAVVQACRDALRGSPRPEDLLPTLLKRANASLYEMGQERGGSYGATAALLWLRGAEARLGWIGDSRIYRLRKGELERLTTDHTRAQELTQRGAAPPAAAGRKSALTRSLGHSPAIDCSQSGPLDVQSGDLYMVATDGVTDVISDQELSTMLAQGPIKGSGAIRQTALDKGGPDNLTAVLVEVEPADLGRVLDTPRIAAILEAAAARDVNRGSRPVALAATQQPRGLAAFFRGVLAGGVKRIALEAIVLGVFLTGAFLTPELMAMMGRRLESVPPGWFLAAGALLYLLLVRLRS